MNTFLATAILKLIAAVVADIPVNTRYVSYNSDGLPEVDEYEGYNHINSDWYF